MSEQFTDEQKAVLISAAVDAHICESVDETIERFQAQPEEGDTQYGDPYTVEDIKLIQENRDLVQKMADNLVSDLANLYFR